MISTDIFVGDIDQRTNWNSKNTYTLYLRKGGLTWILYRARPDQLCRSFNALLPCSQDANFRSSITRHVCHLRKMQKGQPDLQRWDTQLMLEGTKSMRLSLIANTMLCTLQPLLRLTNRTRFSPTRIDRFRN